NKFNVACRSSNDLAASFAGDVTPAGWIYAARDVASELPYYLGPDANYFNISSSFPSLAIDHLGNAHLVFSYAPSPTGRFAADAANVAYVSSSNSVPTSQLPTIYSRWSPRTVVAGGAGTQVFPSVVAQHVNESGRPYIYVGWIDTAASAALG